MKKENKNNQELQSRRQFFRKAAKGALPILGAIALSKFSAFGSISRPEPTDCYGGGCASSCYGTCLRSCYGECKGSCRNSCTGTCKASCYRMSY